VREYVAVHGCVRVLTTAVVAVMVAVRDTSGPSASALLCKGSVGRYPSDMSSAISSLLGTVVGGLAANGRDWI
jgi:hypothetical protein